MSGSIHKDQTIRNPLGRARGLGSAKDGVHHWWMQRVTAIAMLAPIAYFFTQVPALATADHAAFTLWLKAPLNAVAMLVFIAMAFYHGCLGIQVIIEDYIHGEAAKIVSLLLNKLAFLFMGVAAVYAVLSITFNG